MREQREALVAQQKEHRTYRRALQSIIHKIEELRSQNESLVAKAECVWRLARSRGVLVLADGADAWSGSMHLPKGFGYTALDTDEIVA